jgi:16S rRNA (guanine527-N7)-methyltransferase
MTPQAALERGLAELGLALGNGAREKLHAYLALLIKWNRTYNLTAIRDPLRMVTHHLLDSLAVLPELPAGTVADVGSGAGLPGIPIALAEPQRAVTLAEAIEKKSAFLRQAVIELGLANAEVHHGRAESWQPQARFAVVISRGFAELADFFTACRHLIAPGGVLAAMKGVYPDDELARLPATFKACEVRVLRVPLLDAERHLVLCRPGS